MAAQRYLNVMYYKHFCDFEYHLQHNLAAFDQGWASGSFSFFQSHPCRSPWLSQCRYSSTMKCHLTTLVLICLAFSVACLTDGEKSALQQLVFNFPLLNSTNPPWTSNISSACAQPAFYGLNCTNGDDPHVVGMYVAFDCGPLMERLLRS